MGPIDEFDRKRIEWGQTEAEQTENGKRKMDRRRMDGCTVGQANPLTVIR